MTAAAFFRGFGLKISKSLFTTCILLAIATFAIASMTGQAFLRPVFNEFIGQQIGGQDINGGYGILLLECQSKAEDSINFPIEQLSKNIKLNCSELKLRGKEGFKELFASSITDSLFETTYNSNLCKGYDCINLALNSPDPIQRVSALANANFNDYIRNLSFWFTVAAAIFGVLILLLAQGITAKLFGLGMPLAISGLPYFGINTLQARLETILPAQALSSIKETIGALSSAFLLMFAIGIALIAAGLIVKFINRKKGAGKKKDKGTFPKKSSKK